jgi:hypothetical protein
LYNFIWNLSDDFVGIESQNLTYFAEARKAHHLTFEHLGKRLVGNAGPDCTPLNVGRYFVDY